MGGWNSAFTMAVCTPHLLGTPVGLSMAGPGVRTALRLRAFVFCTGRMVTATVRDWYEEEGWGVLDSPETPGGCFVHFSNIEMQGYRSLTPGQQVRLDWDAPGQDGYDFRALRVLID